MATEMKSFRKIIHVDMDCFYAAVEERDQPEYRDKPLAVGGSADRRGVLCTCNYAARKFGLHAAMPTRRAFESLHRATRLSSRWPRPTPNCNG